MESVFDTEKKSCYFEKNAMENKCVSYTGKLQRKYTFLKKNSQN